MTKVLKVLWRARWNTSYLPEVGGPFFSSRAWLAHSL